MGPRIEGDSEIEVGVCSGRGDRQSAAQFSKREKKRMAMYKE